MAADGLSQDLGRIEEQFEKLHRAVDVIDGRVAEVRARVMDVKERIADLEIAMKEGLNRVEEKLFGIEMDWQEATLRLRDIEREVKWVRNLLVPPTQQSTLEE